MKKKIIISTGVVLMLAMVALIGGGMYLLNYALTPLHRTQDEALERLYPDNAYLRPWVDSLKAAGAMHDTVVTIGGTRLNATYVAARQPSRRVAMLIHGYKDCNTMMMHVGYIYYHLGYNLFLPDLYAHGKSEGSHIRMGWLDRLDVMQWMRIANEKFRADSVSTQMVVHGISMGAATTMCVAGEKQPPYVKCYVADCGYTSVRDEFSRQLKDQFGLPSFPLLDIASAMCQWKYGWNFEEASPLEQVKKATLPILVIHGDSDDFVPTSMAQPIYDAIPTAKRLYIAKGSAHARSLSDHRTEYTQIVTDFTSKYIH
ncbi:MAG: alpha/beta hydrolase [Bacteroidales bacterium]|nr:alpha/beta hydrolase [Bacteroidales bacterium]